jgi:hypothetical protein
MNMALFRAGFASLLIPADATGPFTRSLAWGRLTAGYYNMDLNRSIEHPVKL